jgi:hypothetical protein
MQKHAHAHQAVLLQALGTLATCMSGGPRADAGQSPQEKLAAGECYVGTKSQAHAQNASPPPDAVREL